jgi:pilus assembly protein FimV
MGETVALPGRLAQLAAAAGGAAAVTPAAFGFDLGVPALETEKVVEPVAEMTDVDLNLDLGVATASPTPVAGAMDIDLSLPDEVHVPAGSGTSGLDFEFDLDASSPASAPAPVSQTFARTMAAVPEIDFSGINLDLVTSEPVVEMPATTPSLEHATTVATEVPMEAPAAVSGFDVDADDTHEADVATKLELAQAYEEMGDREGARELLQEVLQEGSSQQQETARAKLATLDV